MREYIKEFEPNFAKEGHTKKELNKYTAARIHFPEEDKKELLKHIVGTLESGQLTLENMAGNLASSQQKTFVKDRYACLYLLA